MEKASACARAVKPEAKILPKKEEMPACGQRALARVSYMTSTRAKAQPTPNQTDQFYTGKLTLFAPGLTFFGTYWLVFGGCGSAVLAAGVTDVGIGWLGVSFAFGLSVLTMAYAVGHISGGHFNPAVSLGLMVAGRFPASELVPYWVAQVVGAIAAAFTLYLIVSGVPDFELRPCFRTLGYFTPVHERGTKWDTIDGSIRTSIRQQRLSGFMNRARHRAALPGSLVSPAHS